MAAEITTKSFPAARSVTLKASGWESCAMKVRYPKIQNDDSTLTEQANNTFLSYAKRHACKGGKDGRKLFVSKAKQHRQEVNYRVIANGPDKLVVEMRHDIYIKGRTKPSRLDAQEFVVDYAAGQLRAINHSEPSFTLVNAGIDRDQGDKLYESGDIPLNNFLRY